MGYACPVCDVPQRDGKHLANHLAFTAMLRHEDHEAWLDERVPGWHELSPPELAAEVTEFATETEFEEVFEDTVEGHDHAHGRGEFDADPSAFASGGLRESAPLDAEARRVISEAQELTRRMIEGEDGAGEDGTGEDGAGEDGAEEEGDAGR
ncbi:DUF5810 domain-containing protein [Halegenticoccus soli]|uniref:DUF5810 domain-containing protein n=1 Tax=Halegenticoccus soli TaxID=1985678 RepID=UPI000C6D9B85|nr:DUF5810 domain-containing protein [Halegenticoccus soli]